MHTFDAKLNRLANKTNIGENAESTSQRSTTRILAGHCCHIDICFD